MMATPTLMPASLESSLEFSIETVLQASPEAVFDTPLLPLFPTKFHPFTLLPLELRRMVWKSAVPKPSTLKVKVILVKCGHYIEAGAMQKHKCQRRDRHASNVMLKFRPVDQYAFACLLANKEARSEIKQTIGTHKNTTGRREIVAILPSIDSSDPTLYNFVHTALYIENIKELLAWMGENTGKNEERNGPAEKLCSMSWKGFSTQRIFVDAKTVVTSHQYDISFNQGLWKSFFDNFFGNLQRFVVVLDPVDPGLCFRDWDYEEESNYEDSEEVMRIKKLRRAEIAQERADDPDAYPHITNAPKIKTILGDFLQNVVDAASRAKPGLFVEFRTLPEFYVHEGTLNESLQEERLPKNEHSDRFGIYDWLFRDYDHYGDKDFEFWRDQHESLPIVGLGLVQEHEEDS